LKHLGFDGKTLSFQGIEIDWDMENYEQYDPRTNQDDYFILSPWMEWVDGWQREGYVWYISADQSKTMILDVWVNPKNVMDRGYGEYLNLEAEMIFATKELEAKLFHALRDIDQGVLSTWKMSDLWLYNVKELRWDQKNDDTWEGRQQTHPA